MFREHPVEHRTFHLYNASQGGIVNSEQIKASFGLIGIAIGLVIGMAAWFITGWSPIIIAVTFMIVGGLAGLGLYRFSISSFVLNPTVDQKRLQSSVKIGAWTGFWLGALYAAVTGSPWIISLLVGLVMAGTSGLSTHRFLRDRENNDSQAVHSAKVESNHLGPKKLEKVLASLGPREHTLLYASNYSYRKLLVDVALPMEVTILLFWRAIGFPGRPPLGDLLNYRAAWPWLIALALCSGWAWFRSQTWKLKELLSTSSPFMPVLLAMLLFWGLLHFPGWHFVIEAFSPSGSEASMLALASVSVLWTGYQSTHYFLGYVTVTNLQLNLGKVGWGPLGEAVDPIYIESIAQPAYSVSVIGKLLRWGEVSVEGKAQDDKQFRSIFVPRYKELKEALDESKAPSTQEEPSS